MQYAREQEPFGRGLVALGRREGAYLSARLKPPAQRTAAERTPTMAEVLLAHNRRSDSLREALAAARQAAQA
jgi:hypothetical protein